MSLNARNFIDKSKLLGRKRSILVNLLLPNLVFFKFPRKCEIGFVFTSVTQLSIIKGLASDSARRESSIMMTLNFL